MPVETIVPGTDGCSLPTFGAPVRAFATAYAALAAPVRVPVGGEHMPRSTGCARRCRSPGERGRARSARHQPDGAQRWPHRGQERGRGLLCLAVPDRGLGVAIRVMDGSFRTHAAVTVATLEQLDILDTATRGAIMERHSPQLRNHNGRLVGEIAGLPIGRSRRRRLRRSLLVLAWRFPATAKEFVGDRAGTACCPRCDRL